MAKILYTDLFGTLINSEDYIISEKYTSKEEEFRNVFKMLDDFISAGNYVNIVTSPETHGQINEKLSNLIIKIYNSFSDENKKRLKFYFQAKANSHHDPSVELREIGNQYMYILKDTVTATHINKKEDAIDIPSLPKESSIYAIGDSQNDIGMLLKASQNNGTSSFINIYPCDQYTYSYPADTIDAILALKATMETELEKSLNESTILSNMYFDDFDEDEDEEEIYIKSLETMREINKKLKKQYLERKIDLERIKYDYTKYTLYKSYEMSTALDYREKDQKELKRVLEMEHYKDFEDYYKLVLK